jgi:tyrosinase
MAAGSASTHPVKVRKNQNSLMPAEWQTFINAVNSMESITTPRPGYQEFVNVHVAAMDHGNMDWEVHTMGLTMRGTNFLAWHRNLLVLFEERLRLVDPSITVPYWDWRNDRQIPVQLADAALLNSWGVIRRWDPAKLPSQSSIDAVFNEKTFPGFQTQLEQGPHDLVHVAVGGNMAQQNSPSDPLFFLHHANVDRIWAEWQKSPNAQDPPNMTEILQPKNSFPGSAIVFNVPVSSVVSIGTLSYAYA